MIAHTPQTPSPATAPRRSRTVRNAILAMVVLEALVLIPVIYQLARS